MRKRIIPLMTVLCLLLCLLPSAAFAAETGGTVDTSRSYNFELTAERGQTEVKAAPGDIITVSLPDSQKAAADVNGDGAVNSTDAALIYRKANGKMSNFPAES